MSLYIYITIILTLTACSTAQPISRRSLGRDLAQVFNNARESLKIKLQHHIQDGSRLSITTDTWSARNYREFTTVTGHWIDKNWIHQSTVLDLMELKEPIHSGEYLAEMLAKITDSLGITQSVFTITRDNASPNDVMLLNFESEAYTQRMASKSVEHPWSFTRKDGDIRCIGHIINLAVQAALTHLKATPSDSTDTYWMEPDAARVPISQTQEEVVSALSKLRRHIYIFRNRRGFRTLLERQLKISGIKRHLLTLDMLVRWNSTYEMINHVCTQEEAINAVCASQQIDILVRTIKLTDSDWAIIHHLLKLFEIFVHPSRKLQASTYPTMNYAILQYLQIIKKLKEFQQTIGHNTAIGLATQKSIDKLNEYYNLLHSSTYAGIATICDPRFNFSVFQVVLPSSQDDRKRQKLRLNMKECYTRYQQREQAIRRLKLHENPAPTTQDPKDDDELSDAELYRSAPAVPETETELERYLGQERLPRDIDIYQYWKAKQFDYPIIARIARDYLAIPATSAPSECVFSQGSDVVTKKRNRLTGDSIRMIMCLKAWGIFTDEDSDDDTNDDDV